MKRRRFLTQTALGIAATAAVPAVAGAQAGAITTAPKRRFRFSLKYGMVQEQGLSVTEKFRLLKELGYDGVEMDSQFVVPAKEVLAAIDASGLPVQGVVNANHWSIRLSDPDPKVRRRAIDELLAGIRFAHEVGGSTILLVPGAVRDPQNENHEQVWERSIEGIREAIPLAAEKGVRIAIENVWNGFLYQHGDDAPADQKPDPFIRYVDEINSAWVGLYYDIGNHRKYSYGPDWIRAMGTRIVKCDVKDYRLAKDGKEGFVDIGDGSVDWPETVRALSDINFYGWVSAEVGGGGRERLADILARMRKVLQEA